jgi:predicted heme/steroid binding protein
MILFANIRFSVFHRSEIDKKTFMDTVITKRQLSLRNGTEKPEIWVAFQGKVYDVSASRLWKNGKHYEHWAGQDLTLELADAPHSEAVFEKFECVGRYEEN